MCVASGLPKCIMIVFDSSTIKDIEERLRRLTPGPPLPWHIEHRQQRMATVAEWQRLHPDKVAQYRRSSDSRRKALIKGCIGSHTAQQWRDKQAEYCYRCAYCGKRGKHLTKDHVIPLSVEGTDYISNIVPSCSCCNISKSNNSLGIWRQFKGLQLSGDMNC